MAHLNHKNNVIILLLYNDHRYTNLGNKFFHITAQLKA